MYFEKQPVCCVQKWFWAAGISSLFLAVQPRVMAQQNAGFMYGKVFTHNNTYEGPLRWGPEEACWTDYFNASKKDQGLYKKWVPNSSKEEDGILDLNWDIHSIWKDKDISIKQFNCQFGDLKQLKVLGSTKAKLQFKNGAELEVLGEGYNDIGTTIQVLDKELGLTSLDWDRVDRVEFMACPKKMTAKLGDPLYGTVETNRKERLTGYIQWDHDERFGSDKLDGYSPDGKVSVSFSEILAIEKKGNSSVVTLNSGRELSMSGSNDVASGHRGIFVVTPGKGMVDVPWSCFKRLTLSAKNEAGPSYETFENPKPLSGKVLTFNEEEYSGRLVYDMDESLDFETLEGNDNGLSYTIPFRNIKTIRPKNDSYCFVELKNGETLFLGGSNDVSDGNSGIVIFQKTKKEPTYVPWSKVDQIRFEP